MAKESLEALQHSEKVIHVEYEHPKFHKRVLANLIDILLLALSVVCFILITSAISHSTPSYKNADAIVALERENSQLFEYSTARKTWENVSTWLDNNNDTSFDFRVQKCEKSIDGFIEIYIRNRFNGSLVNYEKITKDYNDSRLSNKLTYNGKKLFVYNSEGTQIIKNPEVYGVISQPSKYYYENFYREYTLTNCGSFMIAVVPNYQASLRTMSTWLFAFQIPVSVICGGFVIYLLPAFFMKRGCRTIGKALFGIGLVDSNILSPTLGRFTIRWFIFFFGEVMLSFFTFGIPFIVSFSMMAFTKKKAGFPDYMLGLTEVDTLKTKIYFSKYEASIDNINANKKPVDFNPTYKE